MKAGEEFVLEPDAVVAGMVVETGVTTAVAAAEAAAVAPVTGWPMAWWALNWVDTVDCC